MILVKTKCLESDWDYRYQMTPVVQPCNEYEFVGPYPKSYPCVAFVLVDVGQPVDVKDLAVQFCYPEDFAEKDK